MPIPNQCRFCILGIETINTVMSISNLKEILIRRIKDIEDENFLNAIKELTDHLPDDRPYELNDFEKQKIAIARKQVKDGKTSSHEEVVERVESWLKE